MRVLVTGGAGYIGGVVADELLRDGHQVVVYDSLTHGHREAIPPQAEFVKADLLDGAALRRALHAQATEAVIHLAAHSQVGESMEQPARYYYNNVVGTLSLLEAMRECGTRALVFSSTAAVYGEPARLPIGEDDPVQPKSPYGETKLAAENALRWYARAYGLRVACLRYFNAAGASERWGELHEPETHLIPLVLQAAAGLRPEVVVHGTDYPTPDGTCVRDYIHVIDLARAHLLALSALAAPVESQEEGQGPVALTYNLGCGGAGYSVRQVLQAASEVTGQPIPVRLGPRRPGDPPVLVASAQKIQAELGWTPQHADLHAMVASAWRWLQRRLEQRPQG